MDARMGPPWKFGEIETFFKGRKVYNENWEAIADMLPHRTPENVEALYLKNKAFLSLSDSDPTTLHAIMEDHYNSIGDEDAQKGKRKRKQSVKAREAEANANAVATPSPSRPKRKRKSTRKSDDTESDEPTPKRKRTSSRKSTPKKGKAASTTTTPKRKASNTRAKSTPRRRKGATTPPAKKMVTSEDIEFARRSLAHLTPANVSPDSQSAMQALATLALSPAALPPKLRGKAAFSPTRGVLDAPVPPLIPRRHTFSAAEKCKHVVTGSDSEWARARLIHALNPRLRNWAMCEFFYPTVDRGFFCTDDFGECLQALGLDKVGKLNKSEWNYIRLMMGKPRRMSQAFFAEEREKLRCYREDVHLVQQGKKPKHGDVENAPKPLALAQRVTAIHPGSHSLHTGMVRSVEPNGVLRIQFDRPELGTVVVFDSDVMPLAEAPGPFTENDVAVKPQPKHNDAMPLAEAPGPFTENDVAVKPQPKHKGKRVGMDAFFSPPSSPSSSDDETSTTTMSAATVAKVERLLDAKELLLKAQKEYNNKAQQLHSKTSWRFLREYTWILQRLEEVNDTLEPILLKFRSHPLVASPTPRQLSTPVPSMSMRNIRPFSEAAVQKVVSKSTSRAHQIVSELTDRLTNGDVIGENGIGGATHDLIAACTMLTLNLQEIVSGEREYSPAEVSALIDGAMTSLRPKFQANVKSFEDLETVVVKLKAVLNQSPFAVME